MSDFLPRHEKFDLLYIRWSRLRDLLAAGAVSPDLQTHLHFIVTQLERELRELNPSWQVKPFPLGFELRRAG
jgi:hypothetical protein